MKNRLQKIRDSIMGNKIINKKGITHLIHLRASEIIIIIINKEEMGKIFTSNKIIKITI